MVFTASPVGENFRVRSQRFLATVTSTVIDWFQPWPESSLFSVAKKFLDELDLGEENIRNAVVEFMPYSFALVNKVGVGAVVTMNQNNRLLIDTNKNLEALGVLLPKGMVHVLRAVREGINTNGSPKGSWTGLAPLPSWFIPSSVVGVK